MDNRVGMLLLPFQLPSVFIYFFQTLSMVALGLPKWDGHGPLAFGEFFLGGKLGDTGHAKLHLFVFVVAGRIGAARPPPL